MYDGMRCKEMEDEVRTPEIGDVYVRNHTHYTIVAVTPNAVKMTKRRGGQDITVEETRQRFEAEVAAGNAVYHPLCNNCGSVFSQSSDHPGIGMGLCEACWYQQASVEERCKREDSWIANEALRSDDAKQYLLDFIGDPVNTFHDRCDAETLLSHKVETSEFLDAWFNCPNCGEGEQFPMNPDGSIVCHCGEQLKEADEE